MTVTDPKLRELIDAYLDCKQSAQKYLDEAEALSAQILDATPDTGKQELAPGVGVTITSPRRTFNEQTARNVLDDTLIKACTETKTAVSGSLAKKVLAPSIYEACCTSSGQRGIRAL